MHLSQYSFTCRAKNETNLGAIKYFFEWCWLIFYSLCKGRGPDLRLICYAPFVNPMKFDKKTFLHIRSSLLLSYIISL